MNLHSLYIYPVKGCRGIKVNEIRVQNTGLQYDRCFMIVDTNHRFVSQRQIPQLALIETEISSDLLILRFKDENVSCSLNQNDRKKMMVSVWNDQVSAFDCGDQIADWLSRHLAQAVRLVRFDHETTRLVNMRYTNPYQVSYTFADGFPFLVLGLESLQELNQRLIEQGNDQVTIDRFRPNLVITGGFPYIEDNIDTLIVGDCKIKLCKPCTRCKVITINQCTGESRQEPLKTLLQYRFRAEWKGVIFGQNGFLLNGAGSMLRSDAKVVPVFKTDSLQK